MNVLPIILLSFLVVSFALKNRLQFQLNDKEYFEFYDPKHQYFSITRKDTFYQNNQERLIYLELIGDNNERKIIFTFHEIFEANSLFDSNYFFKIEKRRIYNTSGVESFKESFVYYKDNLTFYCLIYDEKSYIVSFCYKSKYYRLELVEFCQKEEFYNLLESMLITT